jgi:RNA-directed DNA polymerase
MEFVEFVGGWVKHLPTRAWNYTPMLWVQMLYPYKSPESSYNFREWGIFNSMKRHNYLWDKITDFENLLKAARQAQKSKRFRENVLKFNDRLEIELLQLQRELREQIYQPGDYRTFKIYEPKPRLISAAPYRDRVVHHALCNIIVPIFDRTFIHHSYANRVGYGTHRALRQFTQWTRQYQYVLQCDIYKYFPSIDHQILKAALKRKIKCRSTWWLIERIIDRSNEQEPVIDYFPGDDLLTPILRRKGLPIGNLTSQFFANCYLSSLDYFIVETLQAKHYLRYVDDFALFSDDAQFLADARIQIETHLEGLRLKIHPIKSQLFETRIGANFVGFRVLPDRIRVRNDNLRRSRLRLRKLREDYQAGKISGDRIDRSLSSWMAHLAHGNTWRLRQKILAENPMVDRPGISSGLRTQTD